VEARIDAIHADRGSEVRKGQILVELDTGHERIALEGARYRAVMESQIRGADTRLAAAKAKLRRREEMVRERFVAPQDRDDTAADMQMARRTWSRRTTTGAWQTSNNAAWPNSSTSAA